jgi:hypothetical protein
MQLSLLLCTQHAVTTAGVYTASSCGLQGLQKVSDAIVYTACSSDACSSGL